MTCVRVSAYDFLKSLQMPKLIRNSVTAQKNIKNNDDFHFSVMQPQRITSFHVTAGLFFYTPWKHEKTSGFLIFSGNMAREKAIGMKCVKDTINPLQQ